MSFSRSRTFAGPPQRHATLHLEIELEIEIRPQCLTGEPQFRRAHRHHNHAVDRGDVARRETKLRRRARGGIGCRCSMKRLVRGARETHGGQRSRQTWKTLT